MKYLVLLSLLAAAFGLSCHQLSDCASVSQQINFVQCQGATAQNAGQCECLSGFSPMNNPSSMSQCHCQSPGRVIYQNGIAHCLQPTECFQQSDCSLVSQQFNFVRCVGASGQNHGTCECANGFGGNNPTPTNQCGCDSPDRVIYQNNVAHCLSPTQCFQQSDCSLVTQNFNFVQCVGVNGQNNGNCQCRQGFGQNPPGTSQNQQCHCNGQLQWNNNVPSCV